MKQIPYCGRTNSGRHRPKPSRCGYLVRGICPSTVSRDIVLSTPFSRHPESVPFPLFEGQCFWRYEVWISVGCHAILNKRHFVFCRVFSLVWTPLALNVIRDAFQMERLFILSEFGCNLNGARYKLMYCIEDNAKSRTVSPGSNSFTSPPVATTSCIFFLLFEAWKPS
jgi:hypothetical protein